MWSPISSQGPNMTNGGIWPIWGWSTDPEPTTPACPPFIFWPLWLHFSRFRASWAFRPFPRGVCQLSGGESWCTDASRAPPNPQHLLPFVILLGKWYWLTSAIGFQCTQTFHIPAASEFPKNFQFGHLIRSNHIFFPLNLQSQSQSETTELNKKEGRGGLDLHRKRRMMTDGVRWLARSKLFLSSASSPCDKGCQNVAFFCDQKPGSEAPCFPTTKTHPITPQILLIGITPGTLGHNVHCQFRCLVNRPEVHTIVIVASLF